MSNKKIKIVIVGLPLFAKRLRDNLANFYPTGKFIHLDTYNSTKDQLKALWMIPRADLVFSINGSITQSKIFDLAFKYKVPLIMNWVGTDVTLAISAFKEQNFNASYIQKAVHFCEVKWIKDELKTIGIEAQIQNFACFDKQFQLKEVQGSKFTVLNYIGAEKPEFYGIEDYLNLAKSFPKIEFIIAGTKAENYFPLPPNVNALGWVDDMNIVFEKTHLCMRMPHHDGLSTIILEALARGKQVIYKYEFENCYHATNIQECARIIEILNHKFESKDNLINHQGHDFVEKNFNSQVILGELISNFKTLIGK